jgi:pyridoxal phosphate enzyme (YggS family)
MQDVRGKIARAAQRVGRDPSAVEILPVTKGHPAEMIRAVAAAGLAAIGENRVAEAEKKRGLLGGSLGIRWHMIGHLQRNKAATAVALFDVIESVDSLRLARRLSVMTERSERSDLEILVQVNTSGEEAKSGFGAAQAVDAVAEIRSLPGLRVAGLMTMAPFTTDRAWLRSTFQAARELFEECGTRIDGFSPQVLSMGMSNDFELAVEHGSTRVRLGTVLLGKRPGQ